MRLKAAAATLLIAGMAHSPAHAWRRLAASPTCPYDGRAGDDGACDTLVAAQHLGQQTVSSINGSSLFTYGRQSGQGAYAIAHPPMNVPGEDYGVGPWTPQASLTLVNPTTAPGISLPGCTAYSAATHYYRCNRTGDSHNGAPFVGSVGAGGVLTWTSGASLTVGNYIYAGDNNGGKSAYAPYQITASLGGNQYQLASAPDISTGAYVAGVWVPQAIAPVTGPQTFYTSPKLTIAGYWFDDVGFWFDNIGYIDIENNRFTIGAATCAVWSGAGPVQGGYYNSPMKVWANYAGFDPACSNSANLYPNPGGGSAQASFQATIQNGTELDCLSGTCPTVGQYIDYTIAAFGGAGGPSQIGANPSPGVYILSNPEPTVTNVAMTTGPILNKSTTTFVMPQGAGVQDIEYNYSDKQSYLATSNDMAPVTFAHNLVDIVGQPAEHTSPWLQEASPYQGTFGVSFVGTISAGAPNQIVTASGGPPQVGWLVSTANNTLDHTFATARVTAVSGSGPYTITLDGNEPAQTSITFYSGALYTVPYDLQDNNAIIFEAATAAGPLPGWTGRLGLANIAAGSATVTVSRLFNCPGGPSFGAGTVVTASVVSGAIQTLWSATLSGGSGGTGTYTASIAPGPQFPAGSYLFSYPYPGANNYYSGGGGGMLLEGGGNSAATFFTTNGFGNRAPSSTTGYYMNYGYLEAKNNLWIVNSSANNINHLRMSAAHGSRTLWQGAGWGSNIGAYPGSVTAGLFSGNYLDPKGAGVGCISVDTGTNAVYTQPAGGGPYSPVLIGNVDLFDGSAITGTSCNGANNP